MAQLLVDFGTIVGKIKPLHGGGQPNLSSTGFHDFHILAEAGIPYSRLHDVGGAFAGGTYVDIPNLFRDFDADEDDPANYDFAFTDRLIEDLVRDGIEPYFRLGVTIENGARVKSYTIDPPKDYEKWARICEHVMAHYLRGWANGYHYKITYWEIWNEPDNFGPYRTPYAEHAVNQMWTGSAEDYYRLYDVTAKHLKAKFPEAQIGGYASCGFYQLTAKFDRIKPYHKQEYAYYVTFFRDFLTYVKEHHSPIDFFSWHSYASPQDTFIWADFVKEELEKAGYAGLPTHLNEWNPHAKTRGTAAHGAEVAAMMLGMQNKPAVALMCIYDMKSSGGRYAPLFNSMTDKPTYAYYAMVAFNHLYRLGDQVKLTSDTEGIYAVAATDGKKKAIMVANLTGESQPLEIVGADLSDARFYIMDDGRLLSWAANADTVEPNAVVLIEFES